MPTLLRKITTDSVQANRYINKFAVLSFKLVIVPDS